MKRKRMKIKSVRFIYSGTEQEFRKFLELLVRDYLRTDGPYTKISRESGVES